MSRGKEAGTAEWKNAQEAKPSRSAKKRASAALQKLGEELASLPSASRDALDLPEDLKEALALHDRITDREGARRQRQFIGRLMRDIDASAIEKALERRRARHAGETALLHKAESWRKKLLEADEAALPKIWAEIACVAKNNDHEPEERIARLKEFIQKANTESGVRMKNNGPGASRQLFRSLMEILRPLE